MTNRDLLLRILIIRCYLIGKPGHAREYIKLDSLPMSPFPSFQPLFNDNSDVILLSDGVPFVSPDIQKRDHFGAPSDASAWVDSPLRRFFDYLLASTALVMSAPLMGVVALLVRASSPGPILFRQKRAGRYRETFTLYKFRSMRTAAVDGPCLTVDGDERITRIGALLRRYKLDELPQLFNVLKGDLSLVGPRPKLPHLEALDLPYRPGITGIATLAFRNEEKILAEIRDCHVEDFYESCIKPRKAQLDREYMRKATLWSDLALMFKTVCSCLLRSDSLPDDEADILKAVAAAWPSAAFDAEGIETFENEANYFARIELQGAQWPADYVALDEALERHGFSQFTRISSEHQPLLTAFYFSLNRADDIRQIAQALKYCANLTGYANNVLVIKSAGSRFHSPPEMQQI